MAKVLIIDDEIDICKMIILTIEKMGHDGDFSLRLGEGYDKVVSGGFDVILLDVNLPDGSGLDLLPKIVHLQNPPEVIIITGFGDPDGAELAIKSGAWDYIQKPISPKRIRLPLKRVLQYRTELSRAKQVKSKSLKREKIVGNSAIMDMSYNLLAQASDSEANVLITGETGTGKELFARAIHDNSARCKQRFVVVDCAALPETLVESVLFGHVKGAFTGAERPQSGLIAQADKGTLFLDEIGELSLSIQKTFLRVLQERRFRPVGAKEEVSSHFRLVAATNRDLGMMVQAGNFRKDLLYRLKTLAIHLPPLREHPEDIKDIAAFHIDRFCSRLKMPAKVISLELSDSLKSYNWPGNVRELINTIETAIYNAGDSSSLMTVNLPMERRVDIARQSVNRQIKNEIDPSTDDAEIKFQLPLFRDALNCAERDYLKKLISLTQGDVLSACDTSGLSRSRLYGLLKKHGLKRK